MFEIKSMAAVAETLWKLNETLSALRASNDHLTEALKAQDQRVRDLETQVINLRADVRVSEANVKLAAVEKAVESASNLVSNVHGPLVQKVADLRSEFDELRSTVVEREVVHIEERIPKKVSSSVID